MARLSDRGPASQFPPKMLQCVSVWWFSLLLSAAILLRWVPGRWINPSFFQAGLFVLAAIWAVQMIFRPYRVRGSFVLVPMAAAVVWPLLQLAIRTTVSRWETENAVLLWSANFLAVFLALQICSESKWRGLFLQFSALFAFIIILISLLEHFSAPDRIFWLYTSGFTDVFGPFVSRDRYAAFGELTLGLFVALAFRKEGHAPFWLGMAAATVAAIVASASRAGSIVALAEAIVLSLVVRRREKTRPNPARGKLTLFVAMVTLFTTVVGVGALAERFRAPDPYADRWAMLQSSIEMIHDRPLFGFGVGNFENAYPRYARFDSDKVVNHAHNDWAEWAVDGGIPFLAYMVAVAWWAVPKAIHSIWGVGILAVFVHSLIDFPLHDPALEFWLFAMVGTIAPSKPTG